MEQVKKRKHKAWKVVLLLILAFFLILAVIFFAYVGNYNHALQEAKDYQREDVTHIKYKDYEVLEPKEKESDSGFIFYPGGKVEPEAYLPILTDLASDGMTSILIHMPFNLAVFAPNSAEGKQSLYPSIQHWFLGGHSLGGAMASSYLAKHGKEYDGLILFAAYSTVDLTSYSFSTLSLLASNDKVLNWDHYESNKKNLPSLTECRIEGGIHSYFGDYGIQKGDGKPSITNEKQREEIVTQVTSFANKVTSLSLL